MRNEIISKRYADAFIEHAKESIGLERGLEELMAMKRALGENPEFFSFMQSPMIGDGEKRAFIDSALKDGLSEESRQFLKLLLKKGRIEIFPDIAEYARVAYSHGTEIDAVLKTSYPLETETIQRIKSILEERFRKKLHLYVELDPDLLGGISVRIENTIIDGSVWRRFEDMRDKLRAMKVS